MDFKLKRLLIIVVLVSLSSLTSSQDHNFFYLKVGIKGSQFKLFFDTGTRTSIIRESTVDSLKLKKRIIFITSKNPPESVVHKRIKIPLLPDINIGKYVKKERIFIQEKDLTASFIISKMFSSDEEIFNLLEKETVGIVGWDIIRQYNWLINFSKKELTLLPIEDTIKIQERDTLFVLNYVEKDNEPIVNLTINEKHNFSVLFDTGADSFLSVGKNIFTGGTVKKDSTVTFHGPNEEEFVVLDSLIINDLKFRNAPVVIASELETHQRLLGMQFMSLFNQVFINNKTKQIIFFR